MSLPRLKFLNIKKGDINVCDGTKYCLMKLNKKKMGSVTEITFSRYINFVLYKSINSYFNK